MNQLPETARGYGLGRLLSSQLLDQRISQIRDAAQMLPQAIVQLMCKSLPFPFADGKNLLFQLPARSHVPEKPACADEMCTLPHSMGIHHHDAYNAVLPA